MLACLLVLATSKQSSGESKNKISKQAGPIIGQSSKQEASPIQNRQASKQAGLFSA